jgi:hypothetical protein
MKPLVLSLCCFVFWSCSRRTATPVEAWIADPHQRVYYGSFGRDLNLRDIKLEAGRNEYAIFQLAVKSHEDLGGLETEVTDLTGPRGTISKELIRVRYPGFLPVDENGEYTPDPLFEKASEDLTANQAQPIWIDLKVPASAQRGTYRGTVTLRQGGRSLADFNVELNVPGFSLPPMNQDHFYFNILMDPGSIARMHKVEKWSEAHWSLIEKYVKNWAEHSQDAITVFFVEDPWEGDTGFPVSSVVDWKLSGTWENLQDPQFQFDYSHFDRFVQMCLDAGIDQNLQAWSPVNMPHHDYAVIHYLDTTANQARKVKVTAGTRDYERVWSQFARSFQKHLKEKNWLDMTTVGLDEISTENLDKIVPVFRKVAPELNLMVSGGDEKGKYNEFSPEMAFHFGYVNSEVPLPDTMARRKQGKRTLMYTANTPLRPNTFLFSKPLESRMLPWLVWKYDFDGYIRWAWNFWVDGFWQQPRYKWRSGDMFFVYPGQEGPMDSIRLEMLRKGAQDYEVLWMIRQKLGQLHDTAKIKQTEEQVKEAIELATQEADPIRQHRPLPSDLGEARKQLNQILLGLSP